MTQMRLKNVKNWLISLMLSCIVALVAHAQSKPTDAQIAEIAEQANEAEIGVAEMVDKQGTNKDVKKLALEIVLLHEKNSRELLRVTKEASINPVPSKTSNTVRKVGKQKKREFKNKKAASFDRDFLDQQIDVYQKFVIEMDKKLIPFAQKPEFREFLMNSRNEVADLLEKVKTLRTTL